MRHSQKVLIILFSLLLCCMNSRTISFAMDPCTITVTQGDARKNIFDTDCDSLPDNACPWAARFWRSYRSAEQVNRVALRWLADRRSDSVLLFVNYMEPHGPWVAPGPAWEKFASEPEEPRSSVWPGPMEPAMRAAVDLYDSQLVSLDRAMGAFFDGLRRLGLYDRALIIVTADHGESLGENSVVGHGQSLQGAELSIPLLIKYPGAVRAGRDPSRVQPIDIFPTIALELGIPASVGRKSYESTHKRIYYSRV